MRLRLSVAALDDFHAAAEFYGRKSPRAEAKFIDQVGNALDDIEAHPMRFAENEHNERCYHTPSFPYKIVYQVHQEIISVIAVAHHRRAEGYWRDREEL